MTYPRTSSGWTCYSCGSFVPSGVTHYCPAPTGGSHTTTVVRGALTNEEIERIARRVVELLKAAGVI